VEGKSYTPQEIIDENIKKSLINYSQKTIIISETLREYVRNDFKTPEQIRHDENLKIAKQNLEVAHESIKKVKKGLCFSMISIVIAIIAIITSIYLSFIFKCC
jgi:hypothetical protein